MRPHGVAALFAADVSEYVKPLPETITVTKSESSAALPTTRLALEIVPCEN